MFIHGVLPGLMALSLRRNPVPRESPGAVGCTALACTALACTALASSKVGCAAIYRDPLGRY